MQTLLSPLWRRFWELRGEHRAHSTPRWSHCFFSSRVAGISAGLLSLYGLVGLLPGWCVAVWHGSPSACSRGDAGRVAHQSVVDGRPVSSSTRSLLALPQRCCWGIFIRWGSSGMRMMLAASEGLTWGHMQLWQGKALTVHEVNIFVRVLPLPRPWQLSAG